MFQKVGEHKVKKGSIFNIQKFCLHDGDGIRTCVFVKGCPLRCIWCHNPEGLEKSPCLSFDKLKCSSCGRCLEVCPVRKIDDSILKIEREKCLKCGKCVQVCLNDANEIIGRKMTPAEVMVEVMQDKMFYDTSGGGLTVSGGEPSFQPEFTLELLSLAKDEGISLAVETCGIGPRSFYKAAADLGTTFLYDIKAVDPMRHRELTGVDNVQIMSNIGYLMERGADIIIRLPLIPGCNDRDEDIALLAEFLNKNTGKYRYAEIMPYHSLGAGKTQRIGIDTQYVSNSATDEEILRWCSAFALYGIDIKVSE